MRISDWSSDVCSSDLTHFPSPFDRANSGSCPDDERTIAKSTRAGKIMSGDLRQRPRRRKTLPIFMGGQADQPVEQFAERRRILISDAPREDRKSTRLNSSH